MWTNDDLTVNNIFSLTFLRGFSFPPSDFRLPISDFLPPSAIVCIEKPTPIPHSLPNLCYNCCLIFHHITMPVSLNKTSAKELSGITEIDTIASYPEKVLQFGTGVLLRGLPGYFIDKANKQGIFKGRIVVVKSTAKAGADAFAKQDNLYTQCIRGIENGKEISENIINCSISRVLNANHEWNSILKCAHNPELKIIVSNTTEVGIQLVNEDIFQSPPASFPAKLLAFLFERFQFFKGDIDAGMIIIPTELIPDNGRKLESILLELAHLNGLDSSFLEWLETANKFCSSLVDRIVPGRPSGNALVQLESELNYTDALLIVSESYRLWAIEGDEQISRILSFAEVDEKVIIENNIDKYRELKLRLLNGTHTLSCGIAFLLNIPMVKDALNYELTGEYIQRIMKDELGISIPYEIPAEEILEFADQVLDRFRNPFIEHLWINITVQYTSKMKMRNIPLLQRYVALHGAIPPLFTLGFAAYLYFTRPVKCVADQYYGNFNGTDYPIQDQHAASFYRRWNALSIPVLVKEVLEDLSLWDANLNEIEGFYDGVLEDLLSIMNDGIKTSLQKVLNYQAIQ